MNKTKVINGLKLIIEGLEDTIEQPTIDNSPKLPFEDTATLAIRLANSYQTYHTDKGVKALLNDIKGMVSKEDKVGFLISWLRKNSVEGIEDFFKKTKTEQQQLLKEAVDNNEETIIKILTKRFY